MYFGEVLRNKRNEIKISLNELSKRAEISPSYISKLENQVDKTPSFEILFKIVLSLAMYSSEKGNPIHGTTYLKDFINTENFNLNESEYNDLEHDYMKFQNDTLNNQFDEFKQREQAKYENKVEYNRTTKSLTITEKPYFDIDWLLTQKRFSVFFGDSFIFNDTEKYSEDEKFLFKEISLEDKKVLHAIIKAYFNSKYEKTNDPFKYFLENVSIYLEKPLDKED